MQRVAPRPCNREKRARCSTASTAVSSYAYRSWTNIDEIRLVMKYWGMASLNVHMPPELREFVDKRTREGRFSTPTEYVRHLIREDQGREAHRRIEELFLEGIESGRARGSVEDLFKRLHRVVDEQKAAASRTGQTMGGRGKKTRSNSRR